MTLLLLHVFEDFGVRRASGLLLVALSVGHA